ncbi:MAG TPA: DNA polymerase/3'-5' exonuclease PolX [Armatimonadota bacterium]|nr:DNA polymerase/3'-5' exonuclease PolX [Armatimonadota bacterium]
MNNAQIAEVLSEIALLLEIKGENPFKGRSYERAAEAVANLAQGADQVRGQKGGLRALPGVGRSIAEKIEELLDTGRCRYHQDLLAEIPATVFDLLRIPGLGPKKVRMLTAREGIFTVEELEEAAQAGRLRDLPGMGEKTEQEILRGIAHRREYSKRTDLGLAWEMADSIMGQIREGAPVEEMAAAGSLRRMKETIGDIDILVTSDDPEAVMERFVSLQLVSEVVARGPTKSTIVTTAGIQADIRVVPPESFGAALQYFTGSKQHNVALRDFAVRKKIKLNEYGVFRVEGEKEERLGGRTEEEMYGALELPLIPPEMREDQGEIEAAREGRLPELVEVGDIAGDLHVHSDWSDGHNTIEEMARAAKEAGYRYLAITDHSRSQTVANGLTVERLRQRRKEIEAARKAVPGIAILEGAEVDIKRDGSLDYPDEVLAELDFVVASVHSGWKTEREAMTARIIKAMENPWVDCIGHPTGRLIGQREPYAVDLEAVLTAAARLGVAMEISSDPSRLDLRDTHARRAKELGVKLIIATDAHRAESLSLIRFGLGMARRAWLEAGDVLNALPPSKLRKRLRRAGAGRNGAKGA